MRRAAVLQLLGLASCAAPRRSEVSLRDPLDVVENASDPAGEFSLVEHLARPNVFHVVQVVGGPSWWEPFGDTGWIRIIRNDWEPEIGPPKRRIQWAPKEEYGLYASPIQ